MHVECTKCQFINKLAPFLLHLSRAASTERKPLFSVSDIQTRAEGESLYIRYPSYEFIGEVILKINIV